MPFSAPADSGRPMTGQHARKRGGQACGRDDDLDAAARGLFGVGRGLVWRPVGRKEIQLVRNPVLAEDLEGLLDFILVRFAAADDSNQGC